VLYSIHGERDPQPLRQENPAATRKQGLTQMQLAERVGMAAAFLSRVEAGEKEPCLGTIEALAQG